MQFLTNSGTQLIQFLTNSGTQLIKFLTNSGTQLVMLGVDNPGRNWYNSFLTAGRNWYTWSCHLGTQPIQFLDRGTQHVLPRPQRRCVQVNVCCTGLVPQQHSRLGIHWSTPAHSTADFQSRGLTTINSIVHSRCTGHRYMDGQTDDNGLHKTCLIFLLCKEHLITQAVQASTRTA